MSIQDKTIHVIDNFYITAEEGFYTLSEKYDAVKKKTGEQYEAYRTLGYFYTLDQTLTGIVRELERRTFSDQAVSDVKELIGKLSILEQSLREQLSSKVLEHVEK